MARAGGRQYTRFRPLIGLCLVACLLGLAAPAAAQEADFPLPRMAPKQAPGGNPVPLRPDATVPTGALPFAEGTQTQAQLRPTTDETEFDGPVELLDGTDMPDEPIDNLPGGDGPLPSSSLAPDAGPPREIRPGTFTLEARLTADGPALGEGVKWRLFGDMPGPDGRLPLLGEADGGVIYIRLDQGTYFAHASYGRTGATRKIVVDGPTGGDVVVLNAGGMRLIAINGQDQTLGAGDVSFDIYTGEEGGAESRLLVASDADPGRIIPLPSGTYHVVSKYGDANAIVRADVRVDAGKLTEATVYQNAARLTLKLVQQHGGEAIADTAWSVVTTTGDTVMESVGAFPSVVLARGDYTAVARHDNRVFQANFSVQPGVNRDIEVLAN